MRFRQSLLALISVTLLAVASACGSPQQATGEGAPTPEETRQVILAAALRTLGRVQVFDAATLEPLGYVVTNKTVDDVNVAPDGKTVFIVQATTPESPGCCALFALDLTTGELCRLNEPASRSVPSPDGRWVFTQRGNIGLEVFDARTLARVPTIDAPGVYGLHPSPDGYWLFGVTNWDGPSIDVFDLALMKLVRRLPVPSDPDREWYGDNGVWLGEYFYFYLHKGQQVYLWTVTPETSSLDAPVALTVALPGVTGAQLPSHANLVGGGGRLFVYTPLSWWSRIDPRSTGQAVIGGIFVVEPTTREVVAHLASSHDFRQVLASQDGRYLYGVVEEGGPHREGPVRLLKLDAASGATLAERILPSDAGSITTATLPEKLVPRGELHPKACGRPGL
ncbi:MAG: hypothetical protein HYY01_10960 [Chloroflexi bacterium]|nr:hypothetical protein [Chloroflexota bacterium]